MTGGRALEPLTSAHLDRLVEIARRDREGLFERNPHLAVYGDRSLTVALCQGAAQHYVDGRNGIKDMDVWTLYAAAPGVQYPYRRRGEVEFGPSELSDWSGRVDLLGRSLQYPVGMAPESVWQDYLTKRWTVSAWHLAKKPVVLLEPAARRGEIVWPVADANN